MYFIILCTDKPDSGDVRAANRDAHITYLKAHADDIRLGGATPNPDGDGVSGSFLLIEAASYDDAKAWAAGDPFAKAGLFRDVEVRPWNFGIGSGLSK